MVKLTGQGPPLLLLHSSLSSHRQWQALVAQLAKQYLCIQPDLLGYGVAARSAANTEIILPSPFRLADEAAALNSVLDNLKLTQSITEPIILIAHSYGAALALHLARTQSIPIRAMALFEPVAFHLLAQQQDPHSRQCMAQVMQLVQIMHDGSSMDAAASFIDFWQQPGYFSSLPQRMQFQLCQQVSKVSLDFQALISEEATLVDYAQLTMPILLMTGQKSQAAAIQISQLLAQVFSYGQLKSLDCGHMGPLTAPVLVNTQISQFLSQLI